MLCVVRVESAVSLLNTVLFIVLMCKNIFISWYSIIPKGCTSRIEMWSDATERVKRLQILGNKQIKPSIQTSWHNKIVKQSQKTELSSIDSLQSLLNQNVGDPCTRSGSERHIQRKVSTKYGTVTTNRQAKNHQNHNTWSKPFEIRYKHNIFTFLGESWLSYPCVESWKA